MATAKQIKIVHTALETLDDLLAYDYARGYFLQESDIQFAVVRHLYDALSRIDDHWFIAAEHTLSNRMKPDVLCYFLPEKYSSFIEHPEEYLVAVIEIKYWKSPLSDFEKLTKIQKLLDCLVWSVFANHFDPSIHEIYARQHANYEAKAKRWIARVPEKRGATILKCGQVPTKGKFARYAQRIQSFRDDFWINDAKNEFDS